MTTRLLLIRHAETPASRERLFVGATDVELTPDGHEQARVLAQRLRHTRIDALYTSPLRRCVQTSAAIAESTGLRVRDAPEMVECNFGSWEGQSPRDVLQSNPQALQAWLRDEEAVPHGGESWQQLGARVWKWVEQAFERHADRTVVAVTHGGPIMSTVRLALGAPFQAVLTIEIDPCSITLLQSRPGAVGRGAGAGRTVRVRFVNDTTHLADPLRHPEPPHTTP